MMSMFVGKQKHQKQLQKDMNMLNSDYFVTTRKKSYKMFVSKHEERLFHYPQL